MHPKVRRFEGAYFYERNGKFIAHNLAVAQAFCLNVSAIIAC
ncbi:MAG: hypothetical protein ACI4M6_06485 [Christensenellaceae bacterium]